MARDSRLFKPLQVGNMKLQHRIIMAPLTRFRSDENHVPVASLMAEYYKQRASTPGTFIISEATFIGPEATGFDNAPGLWTQEQLQAWKVVTDAVHAQGGYIYCQLWALGRAATEKILKKKGFDVVSSSAVPFSKKSAVPRAISEDEIWKFVRMYGQAAKNAVEVAGFDGVEIHAANGYLIDQFTQDKCNQRTDGWGGSVEKRARFGLEVAKACVEAVGASRVGIRLSPFSSFQGMRMDDPFPQFTYMASKLNELKLAYLHLVESRIDGPSDTNLSGDLGFAVRAWNQVSPVFIAGGFTPESAVAKVDKDFPDRDVAIVFGRHFISNPDLPFRIQTGIPLNEYNRRTFYKVRSPDGYVDYPFSKEWKEFSARL